MTTSQNRKRITDQDTELIEAINAGQSDRFPELLKRYEQKLYNFGLRMCGDVRDAEDMVQDADRARYRAKASGRAQCEIGAQQAPR